MASRPPAAIVLDCEGPLPSTEERAFFRDADPWGFILFARHCENEEAVRACCDALRESVGRAAPILIDQEGGRVARMKPPAFAAHPAPGAFGALWRLDPAKAREAARLNGYLLGRLVGDLGVTVNCAPSLDVAQPGSDPQTLGDRTLASHPEAVAALGRAVLDGHLAAGVVPVIKHMPGLGRAACDSHLALPTVCDRLADLQEIDFAPFKALCDAPAGMTAHVVYEAIDPDAPGTLSRKVVGEVIGGEIAFDGLLFSDDLKMEALSGSYADRTRRALDAGCDVAVVCNLTLDQKRDAMDGASPLTPQADDRAARAFAMARARQTKGDVDLAAARADLEALLKPVAA
ncbi:MAG: beta-N-acetylhexosaminidase [Pseudomonadota bacterium]